MPSKRTLPGSAKSTMKRPVVNEGRRRKRRRPMPSKRTLPDGTKSTTKRPVVNEGRRRRRTFIRVDSFQLSGAQGHKQLINRF
jgi:hypothetical protein